MQKNTDQNSSEYGHFSRSVEGLILKLRKKGHSLFLKTEWSGESLMTAPVCLSNNYVWQIGFIWSFEAVFSFSFKIIDIKICLMKKGAKTMKKATKSFSGLSVFHSYDCSFLLLVSCCVCYMYICTSLYIKKWKQKNRRISLWEY